MEFPTLIGLESRWLVFFFVCITRRWYSVGNPIMIGTYIRKVAIFFGELRYRIAAFFWTKPVPNCFWGWSPPLCAESINYTNGRLNVILNDELYR